MLNASIESGGSAPRLGEALPPGEAEALGQIVRAIEDRVREAARHGPARRDAHTKAHGCVRAEFRVLDTVPPALRAGIFAEPRRRFEAWVRFSNGSGTPGNDAEGDGRGMAIKLLGVAGSPSGTQDFLLDQPSGVLRPRRGGLRGFPESFAALAVLRAELQPLRPAHSGSADRRARSPSQEVRNPLSVPLLEHDALCLRRSRLQVLRPAAAAVLPAHRGRRAQLPPRQHGAPPRRSGSALRVHGAAADRRGCDADRGSAHRVGRSGLALRAGRRRHHPAAGFRHAERDAFGENLSFTPWHCLEAHRPLGGINRLRRTVYETISRLRHELNGAPREEPAATAAAAGLRPETSRRGRVACRTGSGISSWGTRSAT